MQQATTGTGTPRSQTGFGEGVGPLNFGLNEGTFMPEACVSVLSGLGHRLALRRYGSPDNSALREALARADGLSTEHVFVREGSGPILRQVIPHLIRKAIKSSPSRIVRHLVAKSGYPLVTTSFTYSKVPLGAARVGLTLEVIPLSPVDGFRLDVRELGKRLERRDGLVYLANPNNPTGRVLVSRAQIDELARRFPRSIFWIDEAYVQYLDPETHAPLGDLAGIHRNVVVCRSFSFAYGLAAARVGYMLADPALVREMDAQLTPYRVGALPEALALAALEDTQHLPWLRAYCAKERALLRERLADVSKSITLFDSDVNFVLCRLSGGRSSEPLARKLASRGITVKRFEPVGTHTFESYFRITLGTHEENGALVDEVRAALPS